MNAAAVMCTLCRRRDAFFFRPYSGEKLCKRCFVQSIESKVRAVISKYHMFDFDDRIAVGVSGGKDSLSLLHILAKTERAHPMASLVAVTVDEGIEGYRDEALVIAAANCKKLGIEHHVVSFKELFGFTLDEIIRRAGQKRALTSCGYCGVLRRRALNLAARDVCADKLATAHTLDDEVHPRLVRKVKPFCEVPEKESTMYAYIKKIRFQATPCPYASEALRNDVRTMLNRVEEKHAGTKFAVFKSLECIRPALDELAQKEDFKECVKCGEPASADVCRACELLSHFG